MSDWRPIETAPRDGRWILLWEKYSDAPAVARWIDMPNRGIRDGGDWTVSKEHVGAEGGWDGAMVVDMIDYDMITHWMPLPEPPETDNA